ncbi:hypothetical protein AGMMS49525_16630 [Bacteroidia bacterium]|nr:hypothetical protein AGMMS49525_16630 [Bacteroidia bacterium]
MNISNLTGGIGILGSPAALMSAWNNPDVYAGIGHPSPWWGVWDDQVLWRAADKSDTASVLDSSNPIVLDVGDTVAGSYWCSVRCVRDM